MQRRRASELYQVDFVAALFGGFLLVWLSGISEAEFPGNDGKQLTFIEISARGIFAAADGTERYWAPFLPVQRSAFRCANSKVVELATSVRKLIPCTKSRFESPLTLPDNVELFRSFAMTQASANRGTKDLVSTHAWGLAFEILIDDASGELPLRLIGIALSDAKDVDPVNGVFPEESQYALNEVGVIPDSLSQRPMSVKVDKPGLATTLDYFIMKRPLTDYPAAFEIDHYYFDSLSPKASPGHTQLKRLEFTLRFDKVSGSKCYRAIVTLPIATASEPLKPC